MGAPALDKFRMDLASQYVDVGIAEQQAICAASGMALAGKKVFAYAIAPFISLRCYEHIRIELAAMNIPVTLVGVGAGFSYDDSGPTHHTYEDISALRIFPNIRINNITDTVMARAFADISCRADYPNYVRLDRQVLPAVYKGGEDFTKGLSVLKKGGDACIVATGNMVQRALEVRQALEKKSLSIGVMDLYTIPINENLFLQGIKGVKKLITLEEHTLPAGMGSAVCETLSDNGIKVPLKRIGLDFRRGYCYKYGGRKNIQSLYGLDSAAVSKAILQFLK
jgi:transketolase